jgi:hypothetical protein
MVFNATFNNISITGTMLMEILRERKIIIQKKKIKVQILIRKIINANNFI